MPSKGDAVGAHHLHDLINHIVLPPKLPQKADEKPEVIERNLLGLVQHVVSVMDSVICSAWTDIATMLRKLDNIKRLYALDSSVLEHELSALSPGGMYFLMSSVPLTDRWQTLSASISTPRMRGS